MASPIERKPLTVPLREIEIFNNEHDVLGFTPRGLMLQQRIRAEVEIAELLKDGQDSSSATIRN